MANVGVVTALSPLVPMISSPAPSVCPTLAVAWREAGGEYDRRASEGETRGADGGESEDDENCNDVPVVRAGGG